MSFFSLCRGLSSRSEVHLALSLQSLDNHTIRRLTDSLEDTSVTVHHCATPLNPGTFANLHRGLRRRSARELFELICRVRPEVVLVNLPTVERGQAVIDAADLSTPRVPVWGFLHSSHPPSIIGAKLGRLRDRMVPALLRRFDYLLAVSASGAQAVSQRYAAGSSEILHPPISIPSVELSPAERSIARLAVGLPQGYLLGVIGRVSVRHKGQDAALRVVAKLRAAGHQVHLIVIGDGPDIGKLRSMAEELRVSEHVSFLGWREDAHELIPLLNAVIITSRHEGMPLTAMQAAATGVPVVGYAVDGLAEFLPHTFRASYGDEGRLAETIAALMQGSLAWPAEEMRTLARSWTDPEHAAERLLRLMSSRMTLQQDRPELVPD